MNKTVILCMSCQHDFFIEEEQIIKNTWGKKILEGEYPNISIYFFRGGYDETSYDEEEHVIKLACKDDWYSTFKKTKLAIQWLHDNNIEYDYIMRTNMSVYVNIDLYNLISNQADPNENIVWCVELAKENTILFPAGKFIVMNKTHADAIVNSDSSYEQLHEADDTVISKIFATLNVNYKTFLPLYFHYFTYHPFYKDINTITNEEIQRCLCMSVRSVSRTKGRVQENYISRRDKEFTSMYKIKSVLDNYKATVEDAIRAIKYMQKSAYDIKNISWYKL